jgi:glucokinase
MSIEPRKSANHVVGVDLGGTNVRAAVVDKHEKIVGQARNPSDAKSGAARVVEQTALTVRQAVFEAGLKVEDIGAVGMAVPGHIDTRQGLIRWSPNFGETVNGEFKMFLDVPFCGPVSEALNIASFAGNDANVAALGEFRYGAGRHVQDMVMYTLGTGIGSGVITSGLLVIGSTGGAAEIGHHVIVAGGELCGCGKRGHLEAYCQRDAILRRAARRTSLRESLGLSVPEGVAKMSEDAKRDLPRRLSELAAGGSEDAKAVWKETGYYLGIGIANVINIFNPSIVVIGGGIRRAEGLMAAAEESMREQAIESLARTCKIVEAALGEDAGVMGAAELAWRMVAGEA